MFTSTFSFTMLQFLLPDLFLSPPPPFLLTPSCVLNTCFHSVLEICIQGPSSHSYSLNLFQSPGICHCSLILHQPFPAYGWSIGFLAEEERATVTFTVGSHPSFPLVCFFSSSYCHEFGANHEKVTRLAIFHFPACCSHQHLSG